MTETRMMLTAVIAFFVAGISCFTITSQTMYAKQAAYETVSAQVITDPRAVPNGPDSEKFTDRSDVSVNGVEHRSVPAMSKWRAGDTVKAFSNGDEVTGVPYEVPLVPLVLASVLVGVVALIASGVLCTRFE